MLGGYTLIDPVAGDPPQEDYYVWGDVTIWGIGLITFGPPTAEQQAWLADPANYANLHSFPTDWISFGFPMSPGPIEIWGGGGMVDRVFITEQGVEGAQEWSIGGLTGTSTFYFSDLSVINGTAAGETLTGTDAAETLNGLGGDDTLIGGGGSDALHGGSGNDRLVGGAGVDRLWGDAGDDLLEPGSDFAWVYIGPHANNEGIYFVDGGAGFDTLVLDYSSSEETQVISADLVFASSQVENVEAVAITGSRFSDVLTGSANADKLFGGGGFDVLKGGGGDDWLDAGAPGASSVGPIENGGYSTFDAVSLDHLFTAGGGAPSVSFSIRQTETSVVDFGARPYAGNIFSFTVEDPGQLAYIDYVAGIGGNGSLGFTITDEDGVVVHWSPWSPTNPIVFPHAGTYFLTVDVVNFNYWDFATMDVTLTLEGAGVLTSNVLEGGAGNDTYVVYSSTDQVVEKAGEGVDTVRSGLSWSLGSNVENLTLTGTAAINGTGNSLANVITGNSASNVLTGGGGADRFAFTELGATDRIMDFSGRGRGQGDKIDLSAIDANSSTAANDAFNLVNKFTGKAGQVVTSYDQQSGLTSISLDVNGDKVPDMVIELLGQVNLTSADFIF
jgi:Ca2+-binding RTX toxin-like protein